MNESLLKKEFKQSDVQRVRNLVNKDFTAKTKVQSGYQKASIKHKEGDIWEESGKTWTIKNGIKTEYYKIRFSKKSSKISSYLSKMWWSYETSPCKKNV